MATLLVAGSVTGGSATQAAGPMLYDEALAAVRTPGFAGVWVDPATNDLVVALTDPSATGARHARAEIVRLMHRPDLARRTVRSHDATYSFRTLRGWHDALLDDVFALPGAVSVDVDERANVVRVGVAPAHAAAVDEIRARLGIPRDAVVAEAATAPVQQLTDRARPLVGGVQIRFAGVFNCSLGFPASVLGQTGFVTAAHCTDVQGVVEGTVMGQPTHADPVAVEVLDPPFLPGTSCPVASVCRASDSAYFALTDAANYAQGAIARPPDGSVTWNGTDRFRITAKGAALLGETVTKVGRTTGRTSGSVYQTCQTLSFVPRADDLGVTIGNQQAKRFVQVCQARAHYVEAGGDSGAPIFLVTSGDDVTLLGVHWGNTGIYSPIANVESELGTLAVCGTGFAC